MQIEKEISKPAKEQRLKNLRAQYFELQMNLAAYEANGDTAGAEKTRGLMESCQKSYEAIEAILID
jgi:hypothetical protein